MSNDSQTILSQEIKQKLLSLVERYQQVKEEVQEVRVENELLKKELALKNERLKNFQNQDKINKIVSNVALEEVEIDELKKKLDNYIKEIDKCISYLNE
jgi:hypothetical protein